MKQQNLLIVAGLAAVAAWFLFFRKGVATGGGFGGGSAGVPSSGAPATSFTTNVKPGGGTAITPGRTLTTGGLQSALAIGGNINDLANGVWSGAKSVANLFADTAKKGVNAVGNLLWPNLGAPENGDLPTFGQTADSIMIQDRFNWNPSVEPTGYDWRATGGYTIGGSDVPLVSLGDSANSGSSDFAWEPDADGYWTAY